MASRTITDTVKASSALLAISTNTILLCTVLYVVTLGKILAPTRGIRNRVRRAMAALAEVWISINSGILSLYRGTRWDVELPDLPQES